MNCFFHPTHSAAARCACCQRQLCSACDHRIKGVPYCQDCIVAGVDLLRRNLSEGGPPVLPKAESHSPLIAALFGLIPGLGAAYNGQNIKSLLHFIIPVSLWQLGDIFSRGMEVPFFLGGAAFYLFSIYDAIRTAKLARVGKDLQAEDEALKKRLRDNTTVWGTLLVGVGLLSVIDLFFPYQLHRFWPFLLILAGLYLLRNYQKQPNDRPTKRDFQAQPPSVIGAPYERVESNLVNAERRFDQWRS